MRVAFLFLIAALCIAAAAENKKPLFQTPANDVLELMPGSSILDNRIFMNNATAGCVIGGSEDWHLTERGFTVAATIRLKRRNPDFQSGYGADGKFLYDHDIIASKGGEFVFGRRSDRWCDQLYFNFMRDGEWSVPLVGTVALPPYDTYVHVAITVRRNIVDFRGFDGYVAVFYVNGEPEKEQMINCGGAVTPSSDPWRLGCGLGVRNDYWSFGGELTDVIFFDTVLSDAEVMALAIRSKPARVAKLARQELNPSLSDTVAELKKTASDYGKWALDALVRNVHNGADQKRLLDELKALRRIFQQDDAEKFAGSWNEAGASSQILLCERSMLLVNTGRHASGYPIIGWYDFKRAQELFGSVPPGWELLSHARSKQQSRQNSASVPYAVTCKKDKMGCYAGTIVWRTPGRLEASSDFTFKNNRLEMDLKMKALSPDMFLDEISFPRSRFRRLQKGIDRLVYPKMSGVVFEKPIIQEVPQPWKNYPNGELNMQFHAYYDDLGGIYFAQEDPYGGCKRFQTRGREGDLEMHWTHPVAFSKEEGGGRSFTLSGRAVWEIFDGDWFDAGQIYKRFLADKAKWWIPTLPRTSTPKWMRENTLWILQLCFNEWQWYDTIASLKELREYFELPFALHYYEWFDRTKGEFPHFYAKASALQTVTELGDAGIYVKPYTDNRTWARHDGLAPGKDHVDCIGFIKAENGHYDFQFKAVAEKYATRSREGALTLEGGGARCAVMCPAVPEWQDYIVAMSRRLAGQGFHAVYHDEVTTAQPIPCFDAAHGHKLNDPRNWLENGYWKMFEKISLLREKYPEFCHDSEDASEPYMQYLDGVCPFRWVDPGQVPLFASIYAGRTQFNGRIYDHVKPGETESFYDKMAVQLVNSEQLGWFTADFMYDPGRRLFTKQLMHLRTLLLPYFNEGAMEHPLKFNGEMPTRTVLWGCLTAQKIVNPKIHHCVFSRPDGTRMILFINASPDTVTVEPVIPAEYGKAVVCSGNAPGYKAVAGQSKLTLEGREFVVFVTANNDRNLSAEAMRIQSGLRRIQGFNAGKLRYELMALPQAIPENGELVYSFDDFPVWHTQPAYRGEGCYELIGHPLRQRINSFNLKLESNTEYELSVAIRKDLDTSSLLRVCNYDKDNRIRHYAVIGEDVPADGIWHHCTVKFRTDADLNRCALYLYLEPTVKTLRIDELKISKAHKQ